VRLGDVSRSENHLRCDRLPFGRIRGVSARKIAPQVAWKLVQQEDESYTTLRCVLLRFVASCRGTVVIGSELLREGGVQFWGRLEPDVARTITLWRFAGVNQNSISSSARWFTSHRASGMIDPRVCVPCREPWAAEVDRRSTYLA